MYRRPKYLEVLIDIRQEMAREADYDVDLFAEIVRSGRRPVVKVRHSILDQQPDEDEDVPRRRVASRKKAD